MTTFNDIITAVKGLFVKKYPDETLYTNWTPTDFERPSFLLENLNSSVSAFSVGTVRMQALVRITAFVEVDEYHNSQLEVLNTRQHAVLGLFACGYIRVGDRALKVAKLEGGISERDFAEVTVTLEWTEDLQEFAEISELPVIEHINIKTEVTTK